MADGRMLRKKISLDGRWGDLENDTHRLLFTVGIAHLDIEGRISGDPREFKAAVAPMLDHITREVVLAFFKDTEGLGLIHRYQANDRWVIQYPGFKKNQNLRLDKEAPSQYPAPTEDLTPSVIQEDELPKRQITPGPEDSGTTPAEGKGSKVNLSEKNLEASASVTGKADDAQKTITNPGLKPADLVRLWNELHCKPMVSEFPDDRRKKAALRIRKRSDSEWWRQLFTKAKVLNKPWLTFDFLLRNDTNCLKVLEGNYDHDFESRGDGRRQQPVSGKYSDRQGRQIVDLDAAE